MCIFLLLKVCSKLLFRYFPINYTTLIFFLVDHNKTLAHGFVLEIEFFLAVFVILNLKFKNDFSSTRAWHSLKSSLLLNFLMVPGNKKRIEWMKLIANSWLHLSADFSTANALLMWPFKLNLNERNI